MEIYFKKEYSFNMENEIKQNVGKIIKKLREKSNLTQEQLAEKLGMQSKTLSKVETGKTFISSKLLNKLCLIFNVKEKYFFDFSRIENPKEKVEKIKAISYMLQDADEKKIDEIYKIILALTD